MNPVLRFWLVVLSFLTLLSTAGFLLLSFLFPDVSQLAVSRGQRLGLTLLAAVTLGVVVWSVSADGGVVHK